MKKRRQLRFRGSGKDWVYTPQMKKLSYWPWKESGKKMILEVKKAKRRREEADSGRRNRSTKTFFRCVF